MLFPERKSQGRKGYPGGPVLVYPVLPPARLWGPSALAAPGCKLLSYCVRVAFNFILAFARMKLSSNNLIHPLCLQFMYLR